MTTGRVPRVDLDDTDDDARRILDEVDAIRAETDPGVRFARLGVDVVAEIDQRLGLTEREREIAQATAEAVALGLARMPRVRPDNHRLAVLEIWRQEMDEYRLRLTGVADGNGRLGKLDRALDSERGERLAGDAALHAALSKAAAELRADIGTPEEAKANREAAVTLRSVKRRMLAALLFAATGIGGAAWGVVEARDAAHDASVRAEARTSTRLDTIELVLFGKPPRTP